MSFLLGKIGFTYLLGHFNHVRSFCFFSTTKDRRKNADSLILSSYLTIAFAIVVFSPHGE
jgi:hypothetical protein